VTSEKLTRLSNYTGLREFTIGCYKYEGYSTQRNALYHWMGHFFIYLNSPLLERVQIFMVWGHVMKRQDEFDLNLTLVLESLFSKPRPALRALDVSILHDSHHEKHVMADKTHIDDQAKAYQKHLQALHGSDLLRFRVQVDWTG
jgi:hypothetical protein